MSMNQNKQEDFTIEFAENYASNSELYLIYDVSYRTTEFRRLKFSLLRMFWIC